MDRRQRRTRQAIYEAFTGLLEKKSYSAITVQDIIDAADIGRSTFYAHFETKDALLKALCTEIFDHVFARELTRERTHDFSGREKDLEGELAHILYHLRDNDRYIRRVLSCEGGELFMSYFREQLEKVFAGELEKINTDVPRDYLLHHMVCDFAQTVRWWMKHEEYSPEDMVRFFLRTTPLPGRDGRAEA